MHRYKYAQVYTGMHRYVYAMQVQAVVLTASFLRLFKNNHFDFHLINMWFNIVMLKYCPLCQPLQCHLFIVFIFNQKPNQINERIKSE